jgi:hypothetical protein
VTHSTELTDDEAIWLKRILDANAQNTFFDYLSLPKSIHDALVDRGLVEWNAGALEITAAGSAAAATWFQ